MAKVPPAQYTPDITPPKQSTRLRVEVSLVDTEIFRQLLNLIVEVNKRTNDDDLKKYIENEISQIQESYG